MITNEIEHPGFVDVHIHGAFGIDFMTSPKSRVAELANRLEEVGYRGFLPTTVTASLDDVRTALDNLPDHPLIWGFHLEGPFISKEYPGAQPESHIRDFAGAENGWNEVLTDPRLKYVTLAPETPGGGDLIQLLSSRGVIVSLGHTNATYHECMTAFSQGARHVTHTFNAMRSLHHREAGTVGFALAEDSVGCELIYDRLHVSEPVARILIKAKPVEKLIAISDATMAAGMKPGQTLSMWNLECVVGDKEVRLKNGTLAGSGVTMADVFINMVEDFGVDTAIQACCINPARVLGRS